MRVLRLLRRIVVSSVVSVVSAGAAIAGIIAYPEPLYAHHAEVGRLRLYSDQQFDPDSAQVLLADVERRLAAAPVELRDDHSVYRIVISNSEWRRRLTFLWNYGAGGVNYYPLGGAVFIRQSDVGAGVVLRADGSQVAHPRTLAYYAAHEIGHSLIGRRMGALTNWDLPVWMREGLADYVGFGGEVDIEALTRALRAGERDLDPARSGLYARYRLLVAYFLEREGWTVERLLKSNLPQAEAERLLLAGIPAS